MKGAILLALALTFGLSLCACAGIGDYVWGTQVWDDFSKGVAGNALVGTLSAQDGAGVWFAGLWSGDVSQDEMQIVDDGTGNLCVQAHQRNGGGLSHYAWVFGDPNLNTPCQNATVNRVSFRAKFVSNTSTRDDKGITVQWANNTVFSNGSSDGTGIQMTRDSYLAEAGWGTQSSGSAPMDSWGGTYQAVGDNDWHQYDMLMFRDGSNICEYYQDGVLFETKDFTGTQWVSGSPGDGPRWIEDIEMFVIGKDTTGVYYWLIDDVSGQYNVEIPEPSTLVAFGAFGIGMLGLIRRRKA